ncbi:hypothetical protein [Clostridium vincentii]|uniref:Uncharacterized protein n=1 Tax=Clostridium vincentii TaxID=52704 RepID=A0A2T0BL18_9CLOT|nr:hypothetical protein [Clostridium vincentii]PRR84567.1 hypothetical protein CLVI_00900 [Clostridium vincentii]
MTLWLQDFRSLLIEKRVSLRIVFLILILLYLFTTAFVVISKEYPLRTNSTNNITTSTHFNFIPLR